METKLKIGDKVTVNNWGSRYPSYVDYFNDIPTNVLSPSQIARFNFVDEDSPFTIKGYISKVKNAEFKVLYADELNRKAVIELADVPSEYKYQIQPIFLIDILALDKVIKHYTMDELREIVGHDFDIIIV